MKIDFLGSNRGIDGARTLLTLPDDTKILIDCGMKQGTIGQLSEVLKWNGRDFEFDVETLDAVILTHAHIDHIGLLPLLVKRGFKGKIIATQPTAEFCKISLPDSAKIMAGDCDLANKRRPKNKLTPLYTEQEAEGVISLIRCYDYNTPIVISENVSITLKNAGHMLGASMPTIKYKEGYEEKTVVFTGDTSGVGGIKHPFLYDADDLGEVDYVIMESTYGNRVHENVELREMLTQAIRKTCLENQKTLLMPVFALQRSSEILWHLREIYLENEEFYQFPIYLDSPMAIKGQKVVNGNREYWGDEWLERDAQLTNLFDWNVIEYIDDYRDSKYLANGYPKIILSSSGMCSGGRVLQHLQSFLPSKDCMVLFSGYQVEGLLGHKILTSEQNSFAIQGNQLIRRANVSKIPYSSHADKWQLVNLLKTSKMNSIKEVFLVHGDLASGQELKRIIQQHLKGTKVTIPSYGDSIRLK